MQTVDQPTCAITFVTHITELRQSFAIRWRRRMLFGKRLVRQAQQEPARDAKMETAEIFAGFAPMPKRSSIGPRISWRNTEWHESLGR